MNTTPDFSCDVLIIGSGAAGLSLALRLAEHSSVTVLSKGPISEGSTFYARVGLPPSSMRRTVLNPMSKIPSSPARDSAIVMRSPSSPATPDHASSGLSIRECCLTPVSVPMAKRAIISRAKGAQPSAHSSRRRRHRQSGRDDAGR